MKHTICRLVLTGFLTIGVSGLSFTQDMPRTLIANIEKEISDLFSRSIKAGENLDVNGMTENVNDTLKSGFIDNGYYFKTFRELMAGFKSGIQGLESQKMIVETKKITVLSENSALLTASGNYSAKVVDGRILNGKFAWTLVYSKINGKWKLIHSHMSNPKA